jgi:hypothetical protein
MLRVRRVSAGGVGPVDRVRTLMRNVRSVVAIVAARRVRDRVEGEGVAVQMTGTTDRRSDHRRHGERYDTHRHRRGGQLAPGEPHAVAETRFGEIQRTGDEDDLECGRRRVQQTDRLPSFESGHEREPDGPAEQPNADHGGVGRGADAQDAPLGGRGDDGSPDELADRQSDEETGGNRILDVPLCGENVDDPREGRRRDDDAADEPARVQRTPLLTAIVRRATGSVNRRRSR